MNLPRKATRKGFVFEALVEAGINREDARSASLLVPDGPMVHALTHKKDFHVILVDNYALFMKYDDQRPIVLGHLLTHAGNHGYVRAYDFWCELEFVNLNEIEASEFDFECALGDVDRSKFQLDYARLANPEKILTVDVACTLRHFVES